MRYFIFLMCFHISNLRAQNVLFINQNALGNNDGTSWNHAFHDLNTALSNASAGDTLWVAAGIYKPDTANNREKRFEIKNGVRVYGGFSGNETNLKSRDWQTNITRLSGNIGVQNDSTDNSYTVVYMEFVNNQTVLDGFTISDGNAKSAIPNSGNHAPANCGGGLYINGDDDEAYPIIQNCTFEHNYAYNLGGGAYVNGRNNGSVAPSFINCIFQFNVARLDGGGLARDGGSLIENPKDVYNCIFRYNYCGRRGGGLFMNDGFGTDILNVTKNTFIFNKSLNAISALSILTGRITGSKIFMDSCFFKGNRTINDIGNSNYRYIDISYQFDIIVTKFVKIKNCKFVSSLKTEEILLIGNSINNFNTTFVEIDNNEFSGNDYSLSAVEFDSIHVTRNHFTGKKASLLYSAGVYGWTNTRKNVFNFGKNQFLIVFSSALNTFISSNIFIGDSLDNDFLIFSPNFPGANFTLENNLISNKFNNYFPNSPQNQNITWKNNIFFNCKNNERFFIGQFKSTVSNCAFDSSFTNLPANVIIGTGNLSGLDPMFRDTANGDYRLLPCSPLINAGTNDVTAPNPTDLAQQPRIQNNQIDIGPYENRLFFEKTATSPTSCAGSHDGSVTLAANACLPITLSWAGGTVTADSVFSGLPSGTFPITITAANGYSDLDTLTVGADEILTYSLATSPVKCFGDSTGSASIFLLNATQPVDYQWITGDSTASISGLEAGNYTLSATDAIGCTVLAEAEITEPAAPLEAALPVIAAVNCPDEMDGSLSVAVAGGTPNYQFLWSNGVIGSTISGLAGGAISGTVTDANGCKDTISAVILEPIPFSIDSQIQHASGQNIANGAIKITAVSGGTAPFVFFWGNNLTTDSIENLLPGTYFLTITDAHDCTSEWQFIVDFDSKTIGNDDFLNEISAFPNPASQFFKIKNASKIKLTHIEITDALGKIFFEKQTISSNPISTSELPDGVYFIHFFEKNKWIQTSRLIVLKK